MATGFIYIVDTLTKNYVQKDFCSVPTEYGDRIYFGPCKKRTAPGSQSRTGRHTDREPRRAGG
jgi:hypothetical protein